MDKTKHLQLQRDWYKRKNADTVWKAERNQQRAEQRRQMKHRAVEHFGRKCHDCQQSWGEDCVFDFHHLDINKDNITPSSVLHRSWETALKELQSCVMLCANCHRIRHKKDNYTHHAKRSNKEKY